MLAEFATPAPPPPELLGRIERRLDDEAFVAAGAGQRAVAHRYFRLGALAGVAVALCASALVAVVIAGFPRQPATGRDLVLMTDPAGAGAVLARVDPSTGSLTLDASAIARPADGVLELWLVAGDRQPPRSLGLIATEAHHTMLPLDASAARALAGGASLAVSAEPLGGSPAPGPTGPVLVTGRLTVGDV